MSKVNIILLRIFGAVISIIGFFLLSGSIFIAVVNARELLTSPGYLLLSFVFPFALLMTVAGFNLAKSNNLEKGYTLAPPWSLYLSSVVLIATIVGIFLAGITTEKFGAASAGFIMILAFALSWFREARRTNNAG
jgi:hypothetical protein